MSNVLRPLFIVLCALPLAWPLQGQEREIEAAGLDRATTDRLVAVANDPATIRLPGDSRVPADSVLPGDVVVMGGLRLVGRITGDLIVVHGDLELSPNAEVQGDITVVNGEVTGSEAARIGGTLIAYRRGARFVQRGDRAREVVDPELKLGHEVAAGSSVRFAVRAGEYNRVEGLPVHVGPVLDTGGRTPFRGRAQLIPRTEGAPFAADRVGYRVVGEQFVASGRSLRLGAGVHSVIDPIESQGLSDRETSWSAFLLTSDQRDHFERRGWSAHVRATPRSWPVDATLRFVNERHGVVGTADPWTVFRSSRDWRLQPLVAEGTLRSLEASVELDTRDDPADPAAGWLVRTGWREGLSGDLAVPDPAGAREVDARFSSALLDLRRYQPVGRSGTLAMRGVLAGSPAGEPLPPQYQHALGGAGSLPGHARFAVDCGARITQVSLQREDREESMFPAYGCDRVALAQFEYRGPLNLDVGFGSSNAGDGRRGARDRGKSWAVFFNAGRGWAGEGSEAHPASGPRTLYDAGLGILMRQAGIYWAVPFRDGMSGSTFTVRLERRF